MAITFTPSGTPATVPISVPAAPGAMPAVDTTSTDTTLVTVGTSLPAWITFAAGAQAGPSVPGSLELQPGVAVLLTNNASNPASPTVIVGDRGASTAKGCTVAGTQAGGQVVITRGTAIPTQTF